MSIATECPSDQELSHWSAGLVAGDHFDRISRHIDRCMTCQRRLENSPPQDAFLKDLTNINKEIWEDRDDQTDAGSWDTKSSVSNHAVRIGGHIGVYCLESLISRGGMGSVFRAQHTMLQRTVALKVLEQFVPDEHAVARRFRAEWRSMGRITDPRIVQPTDAGEYNGQMFLAMELLHGTDLGTLVCRHGRLSGEHTASIGIQAAEGLAAVHAAGLVHRDIKPSNLMVMPDGSIRILDLGLAIAVDAGAQSRSMTDLGQFVGTAEFTSPEQIEYSRGVDWRTDQYSLGCTLYFLLTGRVPFPSDEAGSLRKVLAAHLLQSAPPIAQFRDDVVAGLCSVIRRSMERDAADRYPSMGEFAEALRPFANPTGLPELVREATESASAAPLINPPNPVRRKPRTVVKQPDPGGRHGQYWRLIATATFLIPLGIIANNIGSETANEVTVTDTPSGHNATGDSSQLESRTTPSADANLFTSAGPHRGFDLHAGHPIADDEIVIQLDTNASAERAVHFLEARPGQLNIRYKPDRSGLMKAGKIEILKYQSEFNPELDPTTEPHPVQLDSRLTAENPVASFDITTGTHKQGFFPVHVVTTFGKRRWNGTAGLQPQSFILYCYPDLTFENAILNSVIVKSGQETEFRIDVYNRGTASAAAGRIAVGLQQQPGAIADNATIFADYPALAAGERASVKVVVRVPNIKADTVWYLTFRIDIDNTTHPERDELPIGSWEVRPNNRIVLSNDTSHVPPNNHGMFRLEVRK